MQFTSTIIVALLLAVSTSTVTAATKSANLRGGGSNLQEETAFSDPSPSGLSSSIMHDAANPPLPNLDRSLADVQLDGCPGLDYKSNLIDCQWFGSGHYYDHCTSTQRICWSVVDEDCYCH